MKTKNYSNVQFVITAPKIRTTRKDMKILNMRSILIGIKRTLKYNLIILSEKLMLHIILQGTRYGLLYVESNSLCVTQHTLSQIKKYLFGIYEVNLWVFLIAYHRLNIQVRS